MPEYTAFSDAAIGVTLTRPALCSAIAENIAKTGKPFVKVTLKDGKTEITAMMFDIGSSELAAKGVTAGTVVDVKLAVGEYQGAKNFKLTEIKPCADPEITPETFIKLPPVDRTLMYDEICAAVRSFIPAVPGKYTSIAEMTLKILTDRKDAYMSSSAAIGMHHNLLGGLLYHSYRMVKAAQALCGVYDVLDKELMVCGTALHDIGKIWEYDTTPNGDASFTRAGVLYGHLYLGAEYIRNTAKDCGCDPERVRLLAHMILSHHGTQEWGAVQTPATPEAYALHYIDNLDAKMYVCEEAYSLLKGGELTDKKPYGLDNRIYKPDYPEEE